MPGTGKTATTLEVIKRLERERRAPGSHLPYFQTILINGMQLNNVNLVYTIIYEEITGSKGVSPSAAQLWLDEYFKKGREHD